MNSRKRSTCCGLLALLLVIVALPAHATSPGKNGRIAFVRFNSAVGFFFLYTVNPDGTDERLLTTLPSFFSDWSPDGKRIAFDFFDSDGNEQIATINPDGTDLKQLTSGPGIHEVPNWSPDGSKLVFDYSPLLPEEPGFFTSIYEMNADGSNSHLVTTTIDTFDVEPKYSPDGKEILFVRIRRDITPPDGFQPEALLVMNLDGSSVRQLTPWGVAEHPNWSPRGRWITFDENTPFPDQIHPFRVSHIFRIHSDGSNLEVVFNGTEFRGVRNATFSPDGIKMLFTHHGDIEVIDLKTRQVSKVIKTSQFIETNASWGVKPVN